MFDYYQAPPKFLFDEMKRLAIEIWKGYDNEFGYVDEKVNIIKNIENIKDNIRFIYRMFDYENQNKLYNKASTLLKHLINAPEKYKNSI